MIPHKVCFENGYSLILLGPLIITSCYFNSPDIQLCLEYSRFVKCGSETWVTDSQRAYCLTLISITIPFNYCETYLLQTVSLAKIIGTNDGW